MNILSLFDGISCGMIALQRANIKIDSYYASEIDKDAIKISNKNYPDIIRIGDVNVIDLEKLPKIDLIIGGSPCQSFSLVGKQLNFEDPRGKLFFKYVEILNKLRELNPNIKFLLENVKMKKEYCDILSSHIGVQPHLINSSLFSAQNRQRYYWTNIQIPIFLPLRNITMKDIYLKNRDLRIIFNIKNTFDDFHSNNDESSCIQVGIANNIRGFDILKRVYSINGKSPTLTTCVGGNSQAKISIGNNMYRKLLPIEYERLQTIPEDYSQGSSNSARYKCLGNAWTVDVIAHIFKGL